MIKIPYENRSKNAIANNLMMTGTIAGVLYGARKAANLISRIERIDVHPGDISRMGIHEDPDQYMRRMVRRPMADSPQFD